MTTARRRPRQARAQQRVDALLDATGRVLAADGYAALNTNRVAREAGVSVGSIYQYFANKEALVQALGLRALERLDAALDAILPDLDGPLDWEPLVDRILATLADLYGQDPGFTSVWLDHQASGELAELDRAHDEELVRRMLPFLERVVPAATPSQRRRVARMFVQVAGSVLALTSRASRRERNRTLAEGQRLLKSYLRDVIARPDPRSR